MAIQEPRFDSPMLLVPNQPAPAPKKAYEYFFQKTELGTIRQFATGSSLTELVDCAEKVQIILLHCNPIFDTSNYRWGNQANPLPNIIQARQWEIDRLSEVKQRLEQAIVHKREYYENHWFGKITKFFLKLFCMWNEGNTSAIVAAEDFLLRYDLRYPVVKINGRYTTPLFFTSRIELQWYRANLNIDNFFNYDPPSRTIPVENISPLFQRPSFIQEA
jgi:hypothetical protein